MQNVRKYNINRKRKKIFWSGNTEEHIDRIFGDIHDANKFIHNLYIFIHISMIRPKLDYAEVIWSPHKKKTCVEIRKNTENSN